MTDLLTEYLRAELMGEMMAIGLVSQSVAQLDFWWVEYLVEAMALWRVKMTA